VFDNFHANTILASLSAQEQSRFRTDLEVVDLDPHTQLYAPDGRIEHVFFPLTAVVSTIIGTAALTSVGNEGMLGVELALGVDRPVGRTVVQLGGATVRMSADRFRTHLEESEPLSRLMRTYVHVTIRQILLAGACHRLHSVEQRCARLLLQTQDRVGQDQFTLTQQFLAEMMGVRRATVNPALGDFKKAAIIHYVRGRITIRNRRQLESTACDCYRLMKSEYQRLSTR
jgi:CRP-like cAMP-binding protein